MGTFHVNVDCDYLSIAVDSMKSGLGLVMVFYMTFCVARAVSLNSMESLYCDTNYIALFGLQILA